MKLRKYSIGTGDRFGYQGKAQLKAIIKAQEIGINTDIVWNKSHREHMITNTIPLDVLIEAESAVKELNWGGNYYIDADHINLSNVNPFIEFSNYFTLDIAFYVGRRASKKEIDLFTEKFLSFIGPFSLPIMNKTINIHETHFRQAAENYLLAIKEAKKIYNLIESRKGVNNFIVEISIDETRIPQTPIEVLVILFAIADEEIPIQTIAPKFVGRFNKGIDYMGDVNQFTKNFETLLSIIEFMKKEFHFLDNLKISIHSGSDKFSIYEIMNNLIKKYDTGLHLKTAGTTWLEEIAGIANSGKEGLNFAKKVYFNAYNRFDELCKPYSLVLDIKKLDLPDPKQVARWKSEDFVNCLTHDKSCSKYNPNFRQLLHIGYKIAAELDSQLKKYLKKYEGIINKNVTYNLFERHIKSLFR